MAAVIPARSALVYVMRHWVVCCFNAWITRLRYMQPSGANTKLKVLLAKFWFLLPTQTRSSSSSNSPSMVWLCGSKAMIKSKSWRWFSFNKDLLRAEVTSKDTSGYSLLNSPTMLGNSVVANSLGIPKRSRPRIDAGSNWRKISSLIASMAFAWWYKLRPSWFTSWRCPALLNRRLLSCDSKRFICKLIAGCERPRYSPALA